MGVFGWLKKKKKKPLSPGRRERNEGLVKKEGKKKPRTKERTQEDRKR